MHFNTPSFRSLLCGLLLLTTSAEAQEFEFAAGEAQSSEPLTIVGPSEVGVGELVVLETAAVAGAVWKWEAVGVAASNWIADSAGTRVVFSSPQPGRFVFLVARAMSADDNVTGEAALTLEIASHAVSVTGVLPEPTPPTPPPTPDLPVGKYDLARFAYQQRLAVPESSRTADRIVAACFRALASRIAAGTLSDPQRVVNELGALLKSRLGSDYAAWSGFRAALGKRLSELNSEGDLSSASDLQTAFDEVADGLEAPLPNRTRTGGDR